MIDQAKLETLFVQDTKECWESNDQYTREKREEIAAKIPDECVSISEALNKLLSEKRLPDTIIAAVYLEVNDYFMYTMMTCDEAGMSQEETDTHWEKTCEDIGIDHDVCGFFLINKVCTCNPIVQTAEWFSAMRYANEEVDERYFDFEDWARSILEEYAPIPHGSLWGYVVNALMHKVEEPYIVSRREYQARKQTA